MPPNVHDIFYVTMPAGAALRAPGPNRLRSHGLLIAVIASAKKSQLQPMSSRDEEVVGLHEKVNALGLDESAHIGGDRNRIPGWGKCRILLGIYAGAAE